MAYGSIDIVVHMYGTISLDDDGDDDSGHLLGDLTAGSPHNVMIGGTSVFIFDSRGIGVL